MPLEKEWTQYSVLHLDLSVAKGQDSTQDLRETLIWMMKPLTEVYGRESDEPHRANCSRGSSAVQ